MQRPSLTFNHRVQRVLCMAVLGTAWAVGGGGWAVPAPVSPPTLASQIVSASAPVIVDVRSAAEFAEGHIPGALNVPYREVPDRLDELTGHETQTIVVYCEMGIRAGIAVAVLESAGFEQVVMLQGQMQAWRQADLPIEQDSTVFTP